MVNQNALHCVVFFYDMFIHCRSEANPTAEAPCVR